MNTSRILACLYCEGNMANFEVDVDYLQKAARQTRAVKELTYEYLALQTAVSVLDVGCGPGEDTIAMAALASSAKITGIDIDSEMIQAADAAAREVQLEKRINHVQGSVFSLPFPDSSFDRIRAERLFQVLPGDVETENSILDELNRVLKPGGILVLADTDWATASVDFSDSFLERKLVHHFSEKCRPSGYGGRRLFSHVKKMGMSRVEMSVLPVSMYTFSDDDPLANWLIGDALHNQIISEEEGSRWLSELKLKSERGEFFAVVNMNVIRGIKE